MIEWVNKADPVLVLKWGAVIITSVIVVDYVLHWIQQAIRIRRAQKKEGDVFIIN